MSQSQSLHREVINTAKFAREEAAFEAHRDEFLPFEGSFVVIKDDQVLGIWPDRAEALDAAHQRFGSAPFMVKQILKEEPIRRFSHDLPR
ncbi:hypothetical protein ACYOEI_29180 [Singulisphaera rosea]